MIMNMDQLDLALILKLKRTLKKKVYIISKRQVFLSLYEPYTKYPDAGLSKHRPDCIAASLPDGPRLPDIPVSISMMPSRSFGNQKYHCSRIPFLPQECHKPDKPSQLWQQPLRCY